MKTITRTFIVVLMLATGLQLRSQTIPNPSFENWTTDSVSGMMGPVYFDHPVDWFPFASLFGAFFGGNINLYQSTDNYGPGSTALMIETDMDSVGADLGTILYTNTLPQKLYGYYKFEGNPTQPATVNVFFFHYDAVNDTSVLVAQGTEMLNTTATVYTQFEVDITSILPLTPDSGLIFIEYLYDLPGRKFFVDALSFDVSAGIDGPVSLPELNVYPLPFENELNVEWPAVAGASYQLSLMSLTGQKVWEGETRATRAVIPTADLPKGIYILQWTDGNQVQSRKLIR